MITGFRQLRCRLGDSAEIRGIEIIFSGNAHEREKGIPTRIGEGGSHALCRGDVADLAYRPFRGEPFPGRMRKNGREAEKAGLFIDAIVWIVAISCRPRLLRTMSNPLDSGA